MVSVELEYREGGCVLVGTFSCIGNARLESGKRGWFAVSNHIDWRCGWCLKVHCPVTEAPQHPGYDRPLSGKREFTFEPEYCGSLFVDDARLTVSFRIPDCLDPPDKKSFIWREEIVLGGRAYDCRLRLEMRAPRDGTYLRRMVATPLCVGGIEFVSPGSKGEVAIGRILDSETGRRRQDRIQAFMTERRSEYATGRNRQNINFSAHQKLLDEALEFIDHNPSSHEEL